MVVEEHGTKLLQKFGTITSIPPKKRHLLWSQSPSPPFQPKTLPLSECNQSGNETSLLPLESSALEPIAQIPVSGTDLIRGFPCEVKKELFSDSAITDFELSNSTNSGLNGKTAAFLPTGLQPKELTEPSIAKPTEENSSSEKPALCRTLLDTELLSHKGPHELFVGGHNTGSGVVKQEKSDACFQVPGAHVRECDVPNKTSETEPQSSSVHPYVIRSNWDLNTAMDTWDKSSNGAAINHRECGNYVSGVDDMDRKTFETHPLEMSVRKSPRTHLVSGELESSENDNKFHKSNLVLNGHFIPENLTNLWLNPASISLEPSSVKDKPALSLSVKSMLPSGSSESALSSSVKSEPYSECVVGGIQGDKSKMESGIYRTVKHEPCEDSIEGHPKVMVSNNLSLSVKSEPQGETFHVALNTTEERMTHSKLDCQFRKTFVHGKELQNLKENPARVPYKVNGTLTTDDNEVHDLPVKMPINGGMHLFRGEHLSSDSESSKSQVAFDRLLDISRNSGVTKGNQYVGESSGLVSESMIHLCYERRASEGRDEVTPRASVLPQYVDSGSKGYDAAVDTTEKLSCLDSCLPKSSAFSSDDRCHVDLCGNKGLAGGDEEERTNLSVESGKESQYNEDELCGPNDKVGVLQTAHGKCFDDADVDDGEVRYLQHGVVEGPSDGRVMQHVQNEEADGGSIGSIGASITATSQVDQKDTEIQNHQETSVCFSDSADNQCNEKKSDSIRAMDIENSAEKEVLNGETSKKEPISTHTVPQDQLHEKAFEVKVLAIKSSRMSFKKVGRESHSEAGGCDVKTGGSSLPTPDQPNSSKEVPSIHSTDTRHSSNKVPRGHLAHLNSPPNALSSGKREFVHQSSISSMTGREVSSEAERSCDMPLREGSRPMPSRTKWENSCDRLFSEQRPHRTRDLRCNDGLGRFGGDRRQDDKIGKFEPDFIRDRKPYNRSENLRGNWNAGPAPGSEYFNSTTGLRYQRPKASQLAFVTRDCPVGSGPSTASGMSQNGESEMFSHLPSRSQSPGGTERPAPVGIRTLHKNMRDISPARCNDGRIADLILLDHEEKSKKGSADGMVDPSLVPDPHQQAGDRRGRRSLSPIQRRPPLRLPHNMNSSSSMRHGIHSPHPWLPKKSIAGFEGQSKPIPHRHDCFPEDMVGRRHGSPPYIPRLNDDLRDIGSLRENDFQENERGLHRNMPRFHLFGPQINDGDMYFGPSHPRQLHEFTGDGIDELRNYSERQEFIRSLRQQYNARCGGVGGDENSPYHNERRLPRRPIRFCPEAQEECPGQGDLRERSFRSRVGDLPRRPRSMEEQEDNFHRNGIQEWHESGINNARLKRRRF